MSVSSSVSGMYQNRLDLGLLSFEINNTEPNSSSEITTHNSFLALIHFLDIVSYYI